MILAVDIGNSAVKAALVDGARVLATTRLETAAATEADLHAALRSLIDGVPAQPASVLAVSVVDRWTERLARGADRLGLPCTVVAGSGVPISTALVRPDQTGADRLLGAWAASRLHGTPVIVVDMGTATTVDAVDADGFFLGGAVMPGPALGADALADGTSRLPRVDLDLPDDVIGRDTVGALRSGLIIGHVGAIRELVTRMRPSLGAGRAPVVVTGGHASAAWARQALLGAATTDMPSVADVLDPHLLLKGLGLLAAHRSLRAAAGSAGAVAR